MSYPKSTSCGEIGNVLHNILDNVLQYKTDGTFIEIGANDGKTGSFTYNLASIGWYGFNFEPVPRLFEKCCDNHKRHMNVKNFQLALGNTSTEADIIDANTLSTMDVETANAYKKIQQFSRFFKDTLNIHRVKVERLDTIINEYNITNIDLLVINVEGHEEAVLEGFTINNNEPKIIIIEIPDQHKDFIHNQTLINKYARLRSYFKQHNYILLVNDIVDNVYVHKSIYDNLSTSVISSIRRSIHFPQYIKR